MLRKSSASKSTNSTSTNKKVLSAAIVAIVLIILFFGGRGYRATVKQYVAATMDGDARKIVSLMPKEYVTASIDYGEYDSKKDIINDLNSVLDVSIDAYKEHFGRRWKYSYKIEETYEYSSDEMDMYLYYNDYANLSKKVDAIMEVTYSLAISGNGNHSNTTETLILFKIGSNWYVA